MVKILIALIFLEIVGAGIYGYTLTAGKNQPKQSSLELSELTHTSAKLELIKPEDDIQKGEIIPITINLNLNQEEAISAMDIVLKYDSQKLRLADKDNPFNNKSSQFNFHHTIKKEGELAITAYQKEEKLIDKETKIGTIQFTALKPGKAEIALVTDQESRHFSKVIQWDNTTNILTSAGKATVTIVE